MMLHFILVAVFRLQTQGAMIDASKMTWEPLGLYSERISRKRCHPIHVYMCTTLREKTLCSFSYLEVEVIGLWRIGGVGWRVGLVGRWVAGVLLVIHHLSLVTSFSSHFYIHIGLAHFCPARFLKHKDFRVCARPDYRPKVFWKCLLIDMRHPGLAGLYKSAGLRKKVTRWSSFHAVNPHYHRFDTQPTKMMVFSEIWKLVIMITKQFRSKAERCFTVTAFVMVDVVWNSFVLGNETKKVFF